MGAEAGGAGRAIVARLRSPGLRPLRFAVTGGTAGLVQLGLLHVFELAGAAPFWANAAGFLLAAQVNFALSTVFTWGDRGTGADRSARTTVAARWLRFHAAIGGTALLNMLVFALASRALPDLAASALGIAVAAVANFLLADRLVFRRAGPATPPLSRGEREYRSSRRVYRLHRGCGPGGDTMRAARAVRPVGRVRRRNWWIGGRRGDAGGG